MTSFTSADLSFLNLNVAPSYSVREYGAKGDGVTDDTAAIQAAINAAATVNGTVSLPPGIYNVTAQINVPASCRIIGSGIGSVFHITGNTFTLFYVTGSNVWFDHLAFDNSGGYAITAIRYYVTSYGKVLGCYFLSVQEAVRLDSTTDTQIALCTCLDTTWIMHCGSGVRNVITGCVGSTGRASSRHNEHTACLGCRSIGNTFLGAFGTGGAYCVAFHAIDSQEVSFVGDYAQSCDYGFLLESGTVDSVGCSIVGCSAYLCGGNQGAAAFSCDTSNYWVTTSRVQGFAIVGCRAWGGGTDGHGIALLHGSHHGVVSGCSVENASYHGVFISACSDILLSGCMSKDNSLKANNTYDSFIVSNDTTHICTNITLSACRAIETRTAGNMQRAAIEVTNAVHQRIIVTNDSGASRSPANGVAGLWQTAEKVFGAAADVSGGATGAVGPPAVPTSGTALVNPYGIDATVYLAGGTISAVAVGGIATGITATPATVRVPAGQSITLTYTVAPTWTWFGD